MALTPSNTPPSTDPKAARAAADEDVLLREVDDAVRKDQFDSFFSRYGKLVIGIVVLGLAAFGGYLYWDHRQETALEKESETLISALDQIEAGNLDTGLATLDPLMADGTAGAKTTGQMLKAGVLMGQGKQDEAKALFAAVAADADAPQALRDLATIREVAIGYDTAKPADVIARLKPLAVPGNAFFASAGELVAGAYLEQGKRREAGALFGAIAKDENTPDSLRSRARQMAGMLGVDTIEDVDKLLKEVASDGGEPSAAAPAAAQ